MPGVCGSFGEKQLDAPGYLNHSELYSYLDTNFPSLE